MPFDSQNVESDLVRGLREVRAKIDRPEKWCRGHFKLRDRYCLLGAMGARNSVRGVPKCSLKIERALKTTLEETGWTPAIIDIFNDMSDHAEVLALVDRTIDRELAKELAGAKT